MPYPPPPKAGQCRNNTTNLGENDWVDQTPVVDCSKTHTLQTLVVIKPVEKLTLAQAKQLAGNCDTPQPGATSAILAAMSTASSTRRSTGRREHKGPQVRTECAATSVGRRRLTAVTR
jgi:hypothetical protein